MAEAAKMKFRYFSPVVGRVVPRFGTDTFIGATRSPRGFIVNPDMVVAIPEVEIAKYPKEYRNVLKDRGFGSDLNERTEDDFNEAQLARRRKSEEAASGRRSSASTDSSATNDDTPSAPKQGKKKKGAGKASV